MKLPLLITVLSVIVLLVSLGACNKAMLSKKKMEKQLKKLEAFTYEFGDSSVPPPFHRSYTININKDTALLTVDSYGDTLASKTYPMPKDGFKTIAASIIKNKISLRKEKKENDGCTGGTSRYISYSCAEGESFSGSIYYCGGKTFGTLEGDIDSLFTDIKAFVPDIREVIKSTQ